ncbi:MAG: dienelactone hydrolase family protein [Verrucomicrobiales bacterium]|nr:dienelactone hydrolase family protein [Verrucomicrobiales bacterium]
MGSLASSCVLFVQVLGGSGLAASGTNDCLARSYSGGTKRTLPYRLLLPKQYDSKTSYPLILYLHGAAARGENNAEPLNWGPQLLAESWVRERHNFFLVVPQCPLSSGWTETSLLGGTAKESEALRLALALVGDALPKEFNIDPKRRYLTGVSMGGHAAWVVMVRHPGFFAAAVPVCAGGNPQSVSAAAAKFPVWVFHSDDDHLVPVQQARELVKAWQERGGTAKYTEYTGLRHSSWKKAYAEPDMFDWLFQQRLP